MNSTRALQQARATTRSAVAQLAAAEQWAYDADGPNAAEPAAWSALALTAHGATAAARRAAEWLASIQQSDGAVGVTATDDRPRWPTSLAILSWQRLIEADPTSKPRLAPHIQAAVQWALQERGNTGPRSPKVGHDTTIAGWSWASDTHSWLEPTCFFVQALRAVGLSEHPRTRDGVRMVVDRLLPIGGCNYGNTFALGQMLLPHIGPTGVALMTLAAEQIDDPRIELSLAYLERSIDARTPTASLCFALLGLAAYDRAPRAAGDWIAARLRDFDPRRHATQHQALLLLARAQVKRLPGAAPLPEESGPLPEEPAPEAPTQGETT